MKAYIITEEQKQALFKELELEKLKLKDGTFFVNQDALTDKKQLAEMLSEVIHRRMNYIIQSHLDK